MPVQTALLSPLLSASACSRIRARHKSDPSLDQGFDLAWPTDTAQIIRTEINFRGQLLHSIKHHYLENQIHFKRDWCELNWPLPTLCSWWSTCSHDSQKRRTGGQLYPKTSSMDKRDHFGASGFTRVSLTTLNAAWSPLAQRLLFLLQQKQQLN